MTVFELILLGKSKVRKNKQLLDLFKGFFRESFGREPSCTGCTGFKDFDLLREKFYPTKRTNMQLTKYKVLYSREKILAYLKNGKVHRSRVSGLSDEFVSEFLKHASTKVYPNHNKMVLPLIEEEFQDEDIRPVKMPSQDLYARDSESESKDEKDVHEKAKTADKPRAKKRRSQKKKKDE